MNKKSNSIVFFLLIVLFLQNIISCSDPTSSQEMKLPTEISGYVQKGPFINGTEVTLYELNSNLSQTGRSFVTQFDNDVGSFEITDIELNSNYVLLSANGFYFDEVKGEISASQLSLNALSDVEDKSSVNVNILTHIERARIEQLISEGQSFDEAKATAQNELLSIFGIDQNDLGYSESFNIYETNEEAAVLLAISLIFQGDRSVGELSELLANFASDFKSGGTISDETIHEELHNAVFLNYEVIRENLQSRYESLGLEADIPDFEKYIDQYVESFFEFNVVDIDGNEYETVIIGDQVWMAENLRTTRYANGDNITHIEDAQEWVAFEEGAWVYYENERDNVDPYGKLYNGYAIEDERGLCPEEWDVPNEVDWNTLIEFLGGSEFAGGKMKVTGTQYWNHPNTGATNKSGFSGLPGGWRIPRNPGSDIPEEETLFSGMGTVGRWAITSEHGLGAARRRIPILRSTSEEIHNEMSFIANGGLSVRCIRN